MIVVTLLVLMLGSTTVAADPAARGPTIIDLGTLPGGSGSSPNGISEDGTIAGTADTATHAVRAVRWDRNRRITDLGTLAGYPDSFAQAINGRGIIIGFAATDEQRSVRALRWDQSGRMTDLGTLPGAADSKPFGINNEGTVVGISGSFGVFHAVRWDRAGRISDLGTLGGNESWAVAINGEGTTVGYSRTTEGAWHATKWDREGRITDLAPTSGSTLAFGINDRGVVSGSAEGMTAAWWDRAGRMTVLTPQGAQIARISPRGVITATSFGTLARAMRWTHEGDPVVLDVLPGEEDNWSIADSANDQDTAVGVSGFTAVKWDQEGRVTALGDLPDGSNSWALYINSAGAIVGYAFGGTALGSHAVVWPGR